MGFFDRISQGLARSRERFTEQMNVLLDRGPDLDDDFWDGLEETLILADIGGPAAFDIVEGLRDTATRKALPDAYAVLDLLNERMASSFAEGGEEIFGGEPILRAARWQPRQCGDLHARARKRPCQRLLRHARARGVEGSGPGAHRHRRQASYLCRSDERA